MKTPPPRIELSDRAWRIGLVLITAVAAAIRLHALDRFSYGLDEILQTYWMNGSWAFFWSAIRFDAGHPPLDYLFARLWQEIHPSDAIRKLPVVLYGAATCAAFGALFGRRAGRVAGLVAAALLALAPFHVRYSQELRPYSLALLLLCLALLCLDRYLGRPGNARLALLFIASLALIYTAYIPQILLGLVGLALLTEDSFDADPVRRSVARRAMRWSPVFILLLWVAYLPWWPVQLDAASRRLMIPPAAPLSWARVGRILAFFATSSDGSDPVRLRDAWMIGLTAAGTVFATRRHRVRFLLAWAFGGLAVIEVLWRIHPHWDVARIFLPAGIALCALVSLTVAELLRRSVPLRLVGVALLAGMLLIDGAALRPYFRDGRADWRPLARFLASRPEAEWVFTENQYTQLCLAYYLVGPSWGFEQGRLGRRIPNLEGETVRLTYSWRSGTRAWLVTGGNPPHADLRAWASQFPSTPYPSAEGAVLYTLEPARRDAAFTGQWAPHL